MDDKTAKNYIEQIQADAERLTLKRLKEDKEETERVEAESSTEIATDKKKA